MSNPRKKLLPVIGVTGGIGSGKSTVSRQLHESGCYLIDADTVGHKLLGTEEIFRRIKERWGDGILSPTGEIDRTLLGNIVFTDREQLRELEHILHPVMRDEMQAQIDDAIVRKEMAVVIDAAVLFEAKWDELCSHTIFVDCPAEKRFVRVSRRSSWSREFFNLREMAQFPLDKKKERCCYTIRNDLDMSRLSKSVKQLFHHIVTVC